MDICPWIIQMIAGTDHKKMKFQSQANDFEKPEGGSRKPEYMAFTIIFRYAIYYISIQPRASPLISCPKTAGSGNNNYYAVRYSLRLPAPGFRLLIRKRRL
jgi:hypothetical protein